MTAAVSEHETGELPFLEMIPLEEGVQKRALLLLLPRPCSPEYRNDWSVYMVLKEPTVSPHSSFILH